MLFVLVFAALGGGYYAYKSFASSHSYLIGAGNLVNGSNASKVQYNAEAGIKSKGIQKIVKVSAVGPSGGAYVDKVKLTKILFSSYNKKSTTACARIRAVGSGTAKVRIKNEGSYRDYNVRASSSYNTICAPKTYPPHNINNSQTVGVYKRSGSPNIHIGYINIIAN